VMRRIIRFRAPRFATRGAGCSANTGRHLAAPWESDIYGYKTPPGEVGTPPAAAAEQPVDYDDEVRLSV
jgi:hypothetical protein